MGMGVGKVSKGGSQPVTVNYRKKKLNPFVQIIIASHLACVTIITKCLRCDCHPCFKVIGITRAKIIAFKRM